MARSEPAAPARRRLLLGAAALAATGGAWGSPRGALHLVVAYPAGGPADVLARQIEPLMRTALDRPVVIDNVPGASGGLGVGRVLQSTDTASPPLLVGTPSETVLAPLVNTNLGYRPEQLRLVALVSHVPVALVGGSHLPDAPLTGWAADRAGTANPLVFAHYGVGSHAHLAAEDFTVRAGLPAVHVPYGGVAVSLRDLVGGRADLSFLPFNRGTQALVEQGRLRLYGLASDVPAPRFPGAPAIASWSGFTGFRHDLWTGAFVRHDVPAAAREELRAALRTALVDPAFRALKAEEGVMVASPMDERETERWHAEEVARYRALIASLAPRLRG